MRLLGPVAVPVADIPYEIVRGGNLAISVDDTINIAGIAVSNSIFVADVEIFGIIRGIETLLAKQYVRSFTGPMLYRFEDADAYRTVQIRARNMAGGKEPSNTLFIMGSDTQVIFDPSTGGGSGAPAGSGAGTQTIITPNFSATITIAIQPRVDPSARVKQDPYG